MFTLQTSFNPVLRWGWGAAKSVSVETTVNSKEDFVPITSKNSASVQSIVPLLPHIYRSTIIPSTSSPLLGCLRHFAYSKFRIFRTFFWVSYAIRKWPQFREIIPNFSCHFSMQIYTKFRVFREIL
jgi:hypothetical protein